MRYFLTAITLGLVGWTTAFMLDIAPFSCAWYAVLIGTAVISFRLGIESERL